MEEAINFVGLDDLQFHPKKLPVVSCEDIYRYSHKPKLIIMDEPTVAVDPQSRNKI